MQFINQPSHVKRDAGVKLSEPSNNKVEHSNNLAGKKRDRVQSLIKTLLLRHESKNPRDADARMKYLQMQINWKGKIKALQAKRELESQTFISKICRSNGTFCKQFLAISNEGQKNNTESNDGI